jgi:FtsH-binding integral membrane protein
VAAKFDTSVLLDSLNDRSVRSLLAANGLAIALALVLRWELGPLLWVYWTQSVVMGVFQFRRIMDLKEFSTKNFRINDRAVEPTTATKRSTAFFFLFHYNFFHFGYFIFLMFEASPDPSEAIYILLCAAMFFANHRYSYRTNQDEKPKTIPNIGTMMFVPYLRILPMHLVIIFAAGRTNTTLALLAFSLLKTGADVLMHLVEHRIIYSPGGDAPSAGR